MSKTREMHVISNTHWDREWSANFQETRMRLIEFMDSLLDILDNEPGYNSFVLDSQTAPLEDYLEIRPGNRARIERHVSSGRLLVGPWYTCPEEFSVNGESLVRNLLYGHRVARQFGGVMKVGYTPFSYGQVSQMPQIYAGFGIDSILFYHGVTHDEAPNEFIFEGADGTRLLGSQISSMARYNFYHGVYRKVVWNMEKDDRLYAWSRLGLPFHVCSEDQCDEHYFLLDAQSDFVADRVGECIRELRDKESGVATTPFLAFMMGHDSSVADVAELRIIDEAQQFVGSDKLFHSSLPEWINKVKEAVGDLPVLTGERRTPKVRTGRVHLYSDVLSSRTRVKRFNSRAEETLQRWAEPYAAIAWSLGRAYPRRLLDLAWKTLLQAHAHDSISGSGVDDIERDMEYRLRQVMNISRGIVFRSLAHIQCNIDNAGASPNDVLITVFNASPYSRSGVLTAVLDIPPESVSREFDLVEEATGKRVPVQIATRKPAHVVVNHARDAAHMMKCERAVVHLGVDDIPAFGYTTLRLNPSGRFEQGGLVCGHNTMQNEHVWVQIQPDGTLRIKHKGTGITYAGLHYFEDSGEAGQAWMHVEPGSDRTITSQGFPVSVSLEENGPLLARYRIEYHMRIPAGIEDAGSDPWARLDGFENAACRTDETRDLMIASLVTLRKGARSLEVRTVFNNGADNHRLRIMFPSNLSTASTCWAESAFDVVERPIEPGPGNPWHGVGRRTYPMQRFVDVSDGKAGLAIINDGLREYEVTQDAERVIAITLLRAFEVSICTSAAGWEVHPDMRLSQSPGSHEFRYLIFPHAGRWETAQIFHEVEQLAVPLQPAQAGIHGGALPKRQRFIEIGPENLVLSAVKRAENTESLLLRVFNPTEHPIDGWVKFYRAIRSAELVTLEEKPLSTLDVRDESVTIRVGSKKILTLKVTFKP